MFIKSTYRSYISIFCTVVLVWNIFGWTGVKLISEHLHEDHSYCNINYCTCVVEDGNKICTCHHHDLQEAKKLHKEIEKKTGISKVSHSHCAYEVPHSIPKEALTTASFTEIKAFFSLESLQPDSYQIPKVFSSTTDNLLTGFCASLLRPPQV